MVDGYPFESSRCRGMAVVYSRCCEMTDAGARGARCALNRLGIVLIGMRYRNRLNADQQRNNRYAD